MPSLETLADLDDRQAIHAFCDPCGRSTKLSTPRLIAVYGGKLKISELKRRLACSKCGQRTRDIRIVWSVGGSIHPTYGEQT